MDQAKQPILMALGVLSLLILGYIGYSVFTGDEEESASTTETPIEIPVAEVEPVVVPEPEPEIVPEPEPEPVVEPVVEAEPEISFILPQLQDSDQLVRDGVGSLSQHMGLAKWLMPSELIRKFVVLVDNVALGAVPRNHVPFLAPEGGFQVQRVSEQDYMLDESSFARYDLVTEIFVSIDSNRAVEFYVLLRPLFQEAFAELGYENKKFDDVIFSAIGRLLEIPAISPPIYLTRPVVMYEFADDKQESMSAVQKQLVRMGPKNTRLIQAKLGELAFELRAVLEG
ncbi:MAG: DUF3014 domain-containing protein [Pseudomonadales bacterium]|nr:DUF3014 domain-containing protein [Pseudomonadales bacterium]MDP7360121.1 DUF3014 domain-containing protein [Pseudomonadales bacterium]MDP7597960.1 DUF3014 domain-containing protein [Pseudomonadales bacterium]HJN52661.1 DUF3014 domain-containing protein [Pseudomonadales bacterium]